MVVLAFAAQFAGRRAPRHQHLGQSRRHRRSPSRCARCSATPSSPIRIGRMASIPATCARPPACGWRASSARSRIARPRNGNTASAAVRPPIAATKRCSPGRAHFPAEFAVQDYLNAQADKFVSVFDPNCYLYLSRAMDRFDLSAHGGSAGRRAETRRRRTRAGDRRGVRHPVHHQGAERRSPTHSRPRAPPPNSCRWPRSKATTPSSSTSSRSPRPSAVSWRFLNQARDRNSAGRRGRAAAASAIIKLPRYRPHVSRRTSPCAVNHRVQEALRKLRA